MKDLIACRKLLNKMGWDSVDWINLAQDRDKLRAVVKRVMKIHVP
jgi:hypothetical protein